MVVYTTNDEKFESVAEHIASERSESVVKDVDDIATGEPIVYVDSPSSICESKLLRFQKRLLRNGPDQGAFSVITGYDAKLAEELYETRRSSNGRHAILGHTSQSSLPDSAEALIRVGDDVTTETVERLRDEGIASLSYNASAWPIHIKLADGYICGYPTSREAGDYGGKQPFCVEDGQRSCPLSDNLIPAETLDVSHAFLGSCATMIDNTPSGLPVHVGMGMLNGAESIIGSYRPSPSLIYESLLHYSLLRSGYDLVARTYLLNRNSHVNRITSYPYVPFGRPESTFGDAADSAFTLDASAEDATVRVEDIEGYVVDFTVPFDWDSGGADRFYVRRQSESESSRPPIYYLAFQSGESVRVLLYTGTVIDVDSLTLEIGVTPADEARRSIAAASLENAENARRLEMLDETSERRVENLRHQLHDLQTPTTNEGHRIEAHFESRRQLNGVLGHVNGLREEIVEDRSDGYPERYQYGSRAVDSQTLVAEYACQNCERDVFIKEVGLGTRARIRALGVCPRCGYLFDVPTDAGDQSPSYPIVEGDLWETTADERPMEITFTNPTSDHMDATFSPTLLRVGKETAAGEDIFRPRTVDRKLEPGETTTVEFTIDTRTLRENQHYVLGTVVGNLEVYTGRRMLLVGEKTSYLHPQYW